MVLPRRVSQRLAQSGEEAAPLSSIQTLPHTHQGQEIDAFTEIEEGEMQHVANLASTSAGATTGLGFSGSGTLGTAGHRS
jgi:hypothetical protein